MSKLKLFIAMAVLILLASACSGKTESGRNTEDSKHITNKKVKGEKKMKAIEMNSEMFKSKIMDYETSSEWNYKGDRPAIIDFYATWCGPCKATAPNVEKIAEEYDGKIDVYKVDVDQQQELLPYSVCSLFPPFSSYPRRAHRPRMWEPWTMPSSRKPSTKFCLNDNTGMYTEVAQCV